MNYLGQNSDQSVVSTGATTVQIDTISPYTADGPISLFNSDGEGITVADGTNPIITSDGTITTQALNMSDGTTSATITASSGDTSVFLVGGDLNIGSENPTYSVAVNLSQASASDSTGALTVTGGVGIGGDTYIGGLVVVTGSVSGSNIPTGTLADLTSAQTLTNKTINSASNTLTIAGTDISGDLTVTSVDAEAITTSTSNNSLRLVSNQQKFYKEFTFAGSGSALWLLEQSLDAHYIGQFQKYQTVVLYPSMDSTNNSSAYEITLKISVSGVEVERFITSDTYVTQPDLRIYTRFDTGNYHVWFDYRSNVDSTIRISADTYGRSVFGVDYTVPTDPQIASPITHEGSEWLGSYLYYANTSDNQIATHYDASTTLTADSVNIFADLQVTGEFTYQPTITTLAAASLTVTTETHIMVSYTTTGPVAIIMPSAATVKRFTVTDSGGNALTNAITMTRAGSDTIVGGITSKIQADYDSITFLSDGGTQWLII